MRYILLFLFISIISVQAYGQDENIDQYFDDDGYIGSQQLLKIDLFPFIYPKFNLNYEYYLTETFTVGIGVSIFKIGKSYKPGVDFMDLYEYPKKAYVPLYAVSSFSLEIRNIIPSYDSKRRVAGLGYCYTRWKESYMNDFYLIASLISYNFNNQFLISLDGKFGIRWIHYPTISADPFYVQLYGPSYEKELRNNIGLYLRPAFNVGYFFGN